tara:strand:- start:902 stop:1741 length:840 start_codon:yes stop_codon:yes gene_type:complete
MRILDLFSGIGGFSYSAEKLVGIGKTVQFVENNQYCQQILNKHWPQIPIHSDIRTFNGNKGDYDLLTGGFPCQDLSTGGKERGLTKGTRSSLFYEVIRLLREIKPRFLLLENVKHLLHHNKGETFKEVLKQISESGYVCEWNVISCDSIQGCHKRERIFIIAYPEHYGLPTTEGCPSNEQPSKTKTRTQTVVKFEGGSQPNSGEDVQRVTSEWKPTRHLLDPNWQSYSVKPTISGTDARIPFGLYKNRITALGNSVSPQVAAIPLTRIKELNEAFTTST